MTGAGLVQYTGLRQDCILGQAVHPLERQMRKKILDLMQEYQISARLTFSNSLLREEHLQDRKCNELCALLEKNNKPQMVWSSIRIYFHIICKKLSGSLSGLINYKVLTNFSDFLQEIDREEFRYVVPDFVLIKIWSVKSDEYTAKKKKWNSCVIECCWFGCKDRKACYETVSRKNWEKIVRNIFVQHLIPERISFFKSNGKSWIY